MKKTLLAAALLLTSLSANAYRQEYGTFGSWDAYYLNTGSTELCASRGYFTGGYKVIFNLEKSNNLFFININVERSDWSVPTGQYPALVVVLGPNGETIKSTAGTVYNTSPNNVSQISITLNPDDGGKTFGAIYTGVRLKIFLGGSEHGFDINNYDVNNSMLKLGECVKDHFITTPAPKSNPFTKF